MIRELQRASIKLSITKLLIIYSQPNTFHSERCVILAGPESITLVVILLD